MGRTSIEWCTDTWNPIRGCSRKSRGCEECYAEAIAARFSGHGQAYDGLAKMTPAGPRWTGEIRLIPETLYLPLRWKKPRRVFVNSMSDLFHEGLPDEAIDRIFAVMALAPRHTYQVLTKRPERMQQYLSSGNRRALVQEAVEHIRPSRPPQHWYHIADAALSVNPWPLKNVWLGVSVENQAAADERIPLLLQTPAAVRFVSVEPLLGHVDLAEGGHGPLFVTDLPDGRRTGLHWVICGGESGPRARPMDPSWARSMRDQCTAAGVSFFMKQGSGARPGRQYGVPDDLWALKEMPSATRS